MKLQLKQDELVKALTQFISGQGINLDNKTVSVTFTAGRKKSGVTAEVTVEDAVSTTITAQPNSIQNNVARLDKTFVIETVLIESDSSGEEGSAAIGSIGNVDTTKPATTTSLFS